MHTDQSRIRPRRGSFRIEGPRTLARAAVLAALALACGRRAAAQDVSSLPLVEDRAAHPGRTIAFVISGDGDWAPTVKHIAADLTARGVSVVGLKARSYLSQAKTPAQAARDAAEVLRHYMAAWNADSAMVIGFSRGADMAPFVVRRLPDDVRRRVDLVALLSPSRMANFQFHWEDLIRDVRRPSDVPVLPEVQALGGSVRTLCVYGASDAGSLCPGLPAGLAESIRFDGGHHLGGDTDGIVNVIFAHLGRVSERAAPAAHGG
jgi:type IV secretory pathway VirJ component